MRTPRGEQTVGRRVVLRDLVRRTIREGVVVSSGKINARVDWGGGEEPQPVPWDDLEWSERGPGMSSVRTVMRGGQCLSIEFAYPREIDWRLM